MGLFGNIFKPLQGKLTAKQEENMKKNDFVSEDTDLQFISMEKLDLPLKDKKKRFHKKAKRKSKKAIMFFRQK